VALLTGLLTACTGIADRSAEATALTNGLRALPGVDSATGGYSNDYTKGTALSVRVELAPDAQAADVDAVTALYFSTVERGDFESHWTTLALEINDDSVESTSNGREAIDSALVRSSTARWFALSSDLAGSLDLTFVPGRPQIRYRPGTPLRPTIEALRRSASDVQNVWWTLDIGTKTVQFGAIPDDDVALVSTNLIAPTGAQLVIKAAADEEARPLDLFVRRQRVDDPESAARADLEQVATLKRPVLYQLQAGDGPRVEVMVGGCRPGGSEIEQRLTLEFGTC
jgi:hypothetical protein